VIFEATVSRLLNVNRVEKSGLKIEFDPSAALMPHACMPRPLLSALALPRFRALGGNHFTHCFETPLVWCTDGNVTRRGSIN